jgi:hypothetical protein
MSAFGTMKMPKVFMPQCGTVGALEDAIGLSRPAPFQPTINPVTSNRNRFISRSLKTDRGGVSASRIRNHDGPLLAAGARKNEKLNTLMVHGTRHYHV